MNVDIGAGYTSSCFSQEVAEAGLDHGARLKAVAGELGNRIRIQVVEDAEAVLSCWPNVDVCPARIVGLEEREPRDDALRGQIG